MWITFTSHHCLKPPSSKLLLNMSSSKCNFFRIILNHYWCCFFTETRSPKSPQVRSSLLHDHVHKNVPDDSSKAGFTCNTGSKERNQTLSSHISSSFQSTCVCCSYTTHSIVQILYMYSSIYVYIYIYIYIYVLH